MAAEIEIVNGALIRLGADMINSLEVDKTNARVMKALFPIVRDAELRRHRWKFAIGRALLPSIVDVPLFGIYSLIYQVPSDCLKLIDVGETPLDASLADYRTQRTAKFSHEGNKILTNIPAPLPLRYIQRVTDTGLWDSAFTAAFVCRLAWVACERLTQDATNRQLAMAEYKQAIREAISANALESPPEYPADDSWVTARIT